jgi:hypothetical protein
VPSQRHRKGTDLSSRANGTTDSIHQSLLWSVLGQVFVNWLNVRTPASADNKKSVRVFTARLTLEFSDSPLRAAYLHFHRPVVYLLRHADFCDCFPPVYLLARLFCVFYFALSDVC